mgnify:CR=1 FL=1
MMSNPTQEWMKEQQRVDFVVKEIEKKKIELTEKSGDLKGDIVDFRKNFWEDVTVNVDEPDDFGETFTSIKQQVELLAERERTHSQMSRQIKILERLKDSPYFGRIDFLEDGEEKAEKIYIGLSSFISKDDQFLIYDWRAPVSSLYYDYGPGEAEYDTPGGKIKGEMKLKRQFVIKNSKIEGMFETGITIGDEILREVLGKNASTQMKSIVSTIQKEQNRIIRNEKNRILVVQGVAGSGKTSAALQRVAYLLYRYRGSIRSDQIMLFSPNPLFNSYVSTVLPELGEENMSQTTFREFLLNRLGSQFNVEDSFEQIEYLLSQEESAEYQARLNGIRFKASLQFKTLLERYIQYLSHQGMKFKGIKFRGTTIISAKEIYEKFYSFDQHLPIPNRIQMLKDWIKRIVKKYERAERKKEWVEREIELLDKEEYLHAFKKIQRDNRYTENSFDDYQSEKRILSQLVVKKRFQTLYKKISQFQFIHLKAIYKELFSNLTLVRNLCKDDIRLPDNWETICDLTVQQLLRSNLPYEDATPILYLKDSMEGRKPISVIRHVFIDEAQDYSPFQYAYFKQLFPNSKFTILGDMNQAIYSHTIESPARSIRSVFEGESIEEITLTQSYRSTKPIVLFSREFQKNASQILPFERDGKAPVITLVDEKNLTKTLIDKIQMLKESNHKTIAIICRTSKDCKIVYDRLKYHLSVRLMEKGTVMFEPGVLIIPAYLAKGIEFDAVVIHDCSKYQIENDFERNIFYTACTRAMHELHLIQTKNDTKLFDSIPNDLYILENKTKAAK